MKFEVWYNKNYKKLLIIPAVLLLIFSIYIIGFYAQTGSLFNRDVSLTGGATYTIITDKSLESLDEQLSQSLTDYDVKSLSDGTGEGDRLVVVVPEEDMEQTQTIIEEFLGEPLTADNSSVESVSAGLSEDFYIQLVVAILLAFFWMAAVVFLIFGKGKKVKFKVVLLNILLGYFLGKIFLKGNVYISIIGFLVFASVLIYIYVKNSPPSFAVMLSAFADIVMTLAIIDMIGMKISTAGIVAFLMLIGYSVDTDILLTTRLTKQKNIQINKELYSAFKTGTTMTVTSIIAISAAFAVVYSFGSILNEIFLILLVGLVFDLFNTWITNASLIKWYAEGQK